MPFLHICRVYALLSLIHSRYSFETLLSSILRYKYKTTNDLRVAMKRTQNFLVHNKKMKGTTTGSLIIESF